MSSQSESSSGGVGYNNVPTVRITSNTGFNAAATATVSGGAVTGITVDEGGFGYNDVTIEIIANPADTITTTARAAAIVGRHLEGIVVQETGVGYQSTPTLSLTGGSPSTAAGTQCYCGKNYRCCYRCNSSQWWR